MRRPEHRVNVTLFPLRFHVTAPIACLLAGITLSGCAQRTCANPYVLDFLDKADAQPDISHVRLLHDPVMTVPGPAPNLLACSVWEEVRSPADGRVALRPQYFHLRQLGDGWEIADPEGDGPNGRTAGR